jgi:putative ABC transport system permease protein
MRLKDLSTDRPYEVSGVMADVPENSHLQFGALVSFETMYTIDNDLDQEWNWNDFYTYVGLTPGADIKPVESKLSSLLFTHKGNMLKEKGIKETLHLQKLSDIHLHSALQGEVSENGSYKMVYFLALIAGFIMIVAWLNYINLSTAKYAERAREIGIRKLTGATRLQLIRQFLLETFIVKLLSSIMAITFIQLLLPAFRQLTGSPVASLLQSLSIWGMLAVFMVLGTLLAGVYPAFVLSSFQPIAVFKGKMSHLHGASIRKILVVFQFATSISLIIGTAVVLMQVRYMQNKDLGINMEQVLIVKGPSALEAWDKAYPQRFARFKSEAAKYRYIVELTASDFIPGKMLNRAYFRHASMDTKEAKNFYTGTADNHFLQTYGIKLMAGQNFPAVSQETTPQVIINQTAAKHLGFSNAQEAVGAKVVGLEMDEQRATAEIIGVVQDFHYSSLKETIEPTIFYFNATVPYFYSLKLNSQNIASSVAHIEDLYKEAFLGNPFTYYFLDESFNALYTREVKFGQMVALFSSLAVFIACLGLLGLSYYTIARRSKEIGIRKVLGASVTHITLFLSRDFLKLIIVANLIAWPLAYAGMSQWLQNYAFHIDINLWLFVWPSLIVLLLALLTIGVQTIKAASANPVNSLRNE